MPVALQEGGELTSASPIRVLLPKQSLFLASPGDVAEERAALFVRLTRDLENQGYGFFAYEYDPDILVLSGPALQNQIPFPSDPLARVTICILGEKLGSSVGDRFVFPDGFRPWLVNWQSNLGAPIALPGEQGVGGSSGLIPLTGT